MPECPSRALYRGAMVYDDPTETCWRHLLTPDREADGKPPAEGQIELRLLPVPEAIDATAVSVTMDAGKVSLVSARVPDLRDQDAVLAQLQECLRPAVQEV